VLRACILAFALGGPSPAPAYDAATADTDIETLCTGRGRAYVDARARLEAHPEIAEPAARRALASLADERAAAAANAEGPKDPRVGRLDAERSRIFAFLGEASNAQDVGIIAAELREAILNDADAERWRQMLTASGDAGVDALARLVGDAALDSRWRATLLEDLVAAVPVDRLLPLADQLGSGARELDRTLRRALVRRARKDSVAREVLLPHLDERARGGPVSRRAAAILVRSEVLAPRGPQADVLVALATDEDEDLSVRIAALHALSKKPRNISELRTFAEAKLQVAARAPEQRSELLASFAIDALPAEAASTLLTQADLRRSPSPRLAIRAWQRSDLTTFGAAQDWLEVGLQHAWPIVRVEALRRLSTCEPEVRRRLARTAGPESKGGEAEAVVARAAIEALGRCAAEDELIALVDESGIGFEQRGMAARALVEMSPAGADTVAKRLRGAEPRQAEPLIEALGHASEPSPAVAEALCRARTDETPGVSRAAARSLARAFASSPCS
jgi:hypothetical protein